MLRAELSRIDRLRRLPPAWRAGLALGSLGLAGLIVLALSGIGFAGISRSLSNVHPGGWWRLALNRLSMFLRAASWKAALRTAQPDVRLRSLVVVRAIADKGPHVSPSAAHHRPEQLPDGHDDQ